MTKADKPNLYDNIPNVNLAGAADKLGQAPHTGGMYKTPWDRYGGIGASAIGSIAGSNRTIINPECLGDYIRELNTLSGTVANAAFKPIDVGECGGKTINEMEAMGKLLGDMREALLVLIQNTISYMEGRKVSVETKETTLAAVAGAGATATK